MISRDMFLIARLRAAWHLGSMHPLLESRLTSRLPRDEERYTSPLPLLIALTCQSISPSSSSHPPTPSSRKQSVHEFPAALLVPDVLVPSSCHTLQVGGRLKDLEFEYPGSDVTMPLSQRLPHPEALLPRPHTNTHSHAHHALAHPRAHFVLMYLCRTNCTLFLGPMLRAGCRQKGTSC